MKLGDVIHRLSEFDSEDTIYASEPWTDLSEAMAAREPGTGELPQEVSDANGMKYFLEVSIAQDFVEDWLVSLDEQPTPSAVCRRLIDYAINDASDAPGRRVVAGRGSGHAKFVVIGSAVGLSFRRDEDQVSFGRVRCPRSTG